MASKQYDFKTLVQTYIETQQEYYLHEDFKSYFVSLLSKLEEIFNVKFSPFPKPGSGMLFRATVVSYLSITSPHSMFLEIGAVFNELEGFGERGKKILDEGHELNKVMRQNKELHLQMLYDLFELMYGKIDLVITS
jgi:hypothetical protein